MVRKRKEKAPLPWCLHCTHCDTDYESREQWIKHLLNGQHQEKARQECLQKWGVDKHLKECAVVVFCSFSVFREANGLKMLKRFSGTRMDRLVTDFVWWPQREKVAFMQFESGDAVNRIMESLDENSKAFVDGKLVQMKKMTDFMQLEWEALLPAEKYKLPDRTESPEETELNPSTTLDKVGNKELETGSPRMTTTAHTPSSFICPTSAFLTVPNSICIPDPKTPLQKQFNVICNSVEIPEDEMKHALDILTVIKNILIEQHPSGQVVMIRNYYLRLRNTGTNTLILYAYIADNPVDPNGFFPINKAMTNPIFESSAFQQLLPGFKKQSFDNCLIGGRPYQHESSGFRFNFDTNPLSMGEAYLDLLLQYLCTFDSRVKPVLTLVYFWAKSHDVCFAEKDIDKSRYHCNCPEPLALEWLVVLFLIREGVIPSVRNIQNRPHKSLLICESKTDIGFSADPTYAKKWQSSREESVPPVNTPEFLVSVLTLVQKMFQFYSDNLKDGCWVLNPRDGEIIQREGIRCHKSSLSAEDTQALTALQNSEITKPDHIISNFRIYVLHPVYITWKLSFCVETWTEKTCLIMKNTAHRLESFLEHLSDNKDTLESVLAGSEEMSQVIQLELKCEMNKNLRRAIKTRLAKKRMKKSNKNNGKSKRRKR